MDAFADKLGRVGAWCGQNKYLNAMKECIPELYASYNLRCRWCSLDKRFSK